MSKVDVKMPEDFLLKLSRLGDKTDEICEKALNAGGEVVLAKVKSNLSSVIGKDTKTDSRSTGELERSLGLSPVLIDDNGNANIKIGFDETMLMPLGLLLDLLECHKQYNGLAKPKRDLTIDDIIPYGI